MKKKKIEKAKNTFLIITYTDSILNSESDFKKISFNITNKEFYADSIIRMKTKRLLKQNYFVVSVEIKVL